mmetsp:Transcript_25190/g.38654  ORF Transcript_25190/g.38654 Transcript_25190/m.38654 type:complete len:204 (-) Transcript_25190:186-797(-)
MAKAWLARQRRRPRTVHSLNRLLQIRKKGDVLRGTGRLNLLAKTPPVEVKNFRRILQSAPCLDQTQRRKTMTPTMVRMRCGPRMRISVRTGGRPRRQLTLRWQLAIPLLRLQMPRNLTLRHRRVVTLGMEWMMESIQRNLSPLKSAAKTQTQLRWRIPETTASQSSSSMSTSRFHRKSHQTSFLANAKKTRSRAKKTRSSDNL